VVKRFVGYFLQASCTSLRLGATLYVGLLVFTVIDEPRRQIQELFPLASAYRDWGSSAWSCC